MLRSATVAQQAEQLICNQRVGGSIPFGGSTISVKRLNRERPLVAVRCYGHILRWRGSRVAKGDGL